jgi:diguanylate cyclase (GGDEF)-like protein
VREHVPPRLPRGEPRAGAAASPARPGTLLLGSGAALALLTAILPHAPEANVPAGLAVGALAGALALVLWVVGDRLPLWGFHPFLAAGTVLITLAIHFGGEADSGIATDNEMLYLWVGLYSFYFFDRRGAALQMAVIGLSYGAVLAAQGPPPGALTRWLITLGTLTIAGVLVELLKARNRSLIEHMAAAARTDPLTGLRNRRGFDELLGHELARARRSGRPLSIVVADLDQFKRLNDTLGHAAGDAALVRVAALLGQLARSADVAARGGGDEFTLLLPDTSAATASEVAERLRLGLQTEFDDAPVPLTVSAGLATFPMHGEGSQELLAAADRALYAAKQLGRNCTVACEEPSQTPGALAAAAN